MATKKLVEIRDFSAVLADIKKNIPIPYGAQTAAYKPDPHAVVYLPSSGTRWGVLPAYPSTTTRGAYRQGPWPVGWFALRTQSDLDMFLRPYASNISGHAGWLARVLWRSAPTHTLGGFDLTSVPSCCGALHLHNIMGFDERLVLDGGRLITDTWRQYTHISAVLKWGTDTTRIVQEAGWVCEKPWVRKDNGRKLVVVHYVSGGN